MANLKEVAKMVNWKKKLGLEKTKKDGLKSKKRFKNLEAWRIALSLGLTMSPWCTMTANAAIVRADNGTIVSNAAGNVHHIYAAKVNEDGTIATNRFSQFDLSEKQIANMYFKTSSTATTQASKLFNFVDSKIDIKGTVNAIKANENNVNKIGGDMYFLSPQGMVVSGSGVINAGSLTVLTPTQSWYNSNAGLEPSQEVQTAIINNAVPINASGTITVMGSINTGDGVTLKAAKINVGVDEVGENEQKTKVYSKASIKTGVVDFKDLVNTRDAAGNLVDSDLNVNNLTFTQTGDGNIVLAAEQDYMETSKGATSGYTTENVSAEVNVAGGSHIDASGAADVTATVLNNASTLSYQKTDGTTVYFINGNEITEEQYNQQYSQHGESTNPRLAWGSKVNLTAKVNITNEGAENEHTTIEGDRVNVEARSFNNYNSNNNSLFSIEGTVSQAANLLLNGMDVNYGLLGSKAEVNIGEGTLLKAKSTLEEFNVTTIKPDYTSETAKYKTLNVRAYGSNTVSLGAAAGNSMAVSFIANAFLNKAANGLSAVPGGAVVYGSATTEATVNVNGTLESAGTTNVEALANTELNAKNSVSGTGIAEFGVTVVDGSNTATVNINAPATITSAKELMVQSNALNDFKVITAVGGTDATAASLAIGVANYGSTANTNIAGTLASSNGDVDVLADSSFKNNIFNTINADGTTRFGGVIATAVGQSSIFNSFVSKAGGALNTITLGKISGFANLQENGLLTSGSNVVTELGNALNAGISVGDIKETNRANVNIANTAAIEAGNIGENTAAPGNINIVATTNAGDMNIGATGTSNNYQQQGSSVAALFNGSVLVAQTENTANVNIAGSTGSGDSLQRASLVAHEGNVNINSEAKVDYQRIAALKKGLNQTAKNIKTSFDNLKTKSGKPEGIDDDTWTALENYLSGLEEDLQQKYPDMFDEAGNLKPEYANNENGYGKVIEDMKAFNEASDLNEFLKAEGQGSFNFTYNNVAYTITFDTEAKRNWWKDFCTGAIDLKDAVANSIGIIGNLTEFLDTNNYANYYTNSLTSGLGNQPGQSSGATAAGAITYAYTHLANNANVNIGKNASIVATGSSADATKNNVQISAKADASIINIDGTIMPASGGSGVGSAVIGTHFVDNDAMSVVAEGVELKSTNKLEGKSDAELMQVVLNVGSAMADSAAVAGNVTYLKANSNNVLFIDDEAKLEAKTINLDGLNNTRAVNLSGGFTLGGRGGVGAAVGIDNISRNNLVLVADNDDLATLSSDGTNNAAQDDEETRAKKLIVKNGNLTLEQRAAYYGGETLTGEVKTDSFSSHANTSGYITNVTAELGMSMNDDSDAVGLSAKVGTFMDNTTNRISNFIGGIDGAIANTIFSNPIGYQPKPTNQTATNPQQGMTYPRFSLAASGSVAVNDIDAITASVLDGVSITSYTTTATVTKVENKAEDSSGAYAIGGGATFTWNNAVEPKNQGAKTVAFTGSAGVNILNSTVTSTIKNSTLTNVTSVENTASRDGAAVAAGAAVGLSLNTGTTIKSGAIGASVTVGEVNTKAVLEHNNITATSLTNAAASKDLQATGGMNASANFGGESAASLGLTAAWTSLTNNVKADIVDGEYTITGSLKNYAQTNLTEISAALGLGFSTSAESSNFQGVAAMVKLDNDVQANIQSSDTGTLSITAAKLENMANDEQMGTVNSHLESLASRGVDTNGNSYIADAQSGASYDATELATQQTEAQKKITAKNTEITNKQSAIDAETDAEKKAKLQRELDTLNQEKASLEADKADIDKKVAENAELETALTSRGNTIVAAALEVAAGGSTEGSKAGGAAIAYTGINNDFTATINNATITTTGAKAGSEDSEPLLNVAKSNTLSVGVAAGGNGTGGGLSGSGAVVVSVLQNDIISQVENSVLNTSGADIEALNTNKVVDVAGVVSGGKKSMGLDLVYNYMDTNTGAYLKDTNLAGAQTDAATKLKVAAEDAAQMYGVALGVGISTNTVAANGSLAFNVGHNDVEAVVSSTNKNNTLTNVSDLLISSNDSSNLVAAAGGLSVGKGVAAGGSFAYNQLGDLWFVNSSGSVESDGKNQTNRAILNGYTVTTTEGANLEVKAEDTSKLTTVSFGAAIGSGKFAFEGANATDIVKKSTIATVEDSAVNDADTKKGTLKVDADSTTDVTVVSGVITANFGGTAFGIAASENYMYDDTQAQLAGGNYYLKDALVKADSKQGLLSVGAGAQAGTGSTLGGTVLVNMLDNNVSALIGTEDVNTQLITSGNAAVLSNSQEKLRNYGGELSLSFGGLAGVGLSFAYNEISGSTEALVQNANITAVGDSNSISVHNSADEARNTADKAYNGLVVAADGSHELENIMVTVAAAGGSGSYAAGAGTIVANKLDGATKAKVVTSNVNNGIQSVGNKQDVSVLASDYTKSLSVGGAAGVLLGAGAGGAGIGIASDNLVRSRTVEAGIDGTLAEGKAVANANKLKVNADSKADLKVNAVGVAVAGTGTTAISGAGNISVVNMTNATKAYANNLQGTNNGFSVAAKQDNALLLTTNALSAAFSSGMTVAPSLDFVVVDDISSTEAAMQNSNITHYANGTAEDELKAEHKTNLIQEAADVSLGVAPAGVAASVILGGNNLDEQVATKLENSTIGSENIKAKNYTQQAKDELQAKYINVEVGGGVVGVAFGLDVNLIDSAVANNVKASKVYATNKIDVEAVENRDVNLNSVAAAGAAVAGVGVSVMVTSINDNVDAKYNDSAAKNKDVHKGQCNDVSTDISGSIAQGNSAITSQNTASTDKFNIYIQRGKGSDAGYTTAGSFSLASRTKENEGVNVTVQNSALMANEIAVQTVAKTDAVQRIITATGAIGAAGGLAVNVLKNKEDNSISVDNATLTASNKAEIKTLTSGEVMGEVYQGAIAGTVAANGAFGFVDTKGNNSVSIQNGSVITGKKSVNIEAKDDSSAEMQAIGMAASTYAGAIMISRAANTSNVDVSLTNSTLKNTTTVNDVADKNSTIAVSAIKSNKLDNLSVSGAGGVVGVNGVFVSAYDSGNSIVDVNSTTINGGKVAISSTLTPYVEVGTDSVAVGIGALGVAASYATAEGKSQVTLDASSNLTGTESIDVIAQVNRNENEAGVNEASVNVGMVAISGAVGSLAVNYGQAELNTKANLDSDAAFNTDKLKLQADQQALVKTDITGVDVSVVSLGVTVGSGKADLDTTIEATANENNRIKDMEIAASTELATDEEINGLGFAIAGVSEASETDDTYTADTSVKLTGTWQLAGGASISAINKDKLDTHVDATKATLVGGSGSLLDSTDNMTAKVQLQDTQLTTAKAQNIIAANVLDKKLDLDASGYGAATMQSGGLYDNAVYTAEVNLNNTKLVTEDHEGEVKIYAYTDGSINDINKISTAAVATGCYTDSEENITYANSIVLDNGSSITAKNADKDVTLATYDTTDVNLKATADVQGSAIGTATATNEVKFERNNKVTVNSGNIVYGSNDVNIYAGAKEEGVMSRLDYNALADVYNHSLIALWTDPDLDNDMSLNNQVKIAGEVTSVRHTRLTADEGIATIAASEREFKLIGGTSGKGSVTSTVLGETSPDESINNFIDLTGGKVTAGIHSNLELNIEGVAKGVADEKSTEEKPIGSLDTSGITITVTKGADWFDKDSITVGTVTIANTLLEHYNAVAEAMSQYNPGSDEYNLQKNELQKILDEMVVEGFASVEKVQKDGEEYKNYYIEEAIYEAAVKLPNIVVSGGSIYLTSKKLNSDASSSLTAKGTDALTINNASNLYLYVQDAKIKSAGGEIIYNDKDIKADDFKGTIVQTADGTRPDLNITSTGSRTDKDGVEYVKSDNVPPAFIPSIGIFGTVANESGDVLVETKNPGVNIYVDAKAQVAGQNVSLVSAQGDVVQTSSGLLMVGGDPVEQYQFSEEIAKKIQTVYNDILILGSYSDMTMDSFSFNDYASYCQFLIDKASAFNFTDNEKSLIADAKAKASGAPAGIIGGQNVYLSGVNVNIGGLVQSGYQNYRAVLDENAQAKVAELDNNYAGRVLSDKEVLGNEAYLVNKIGEGNLASMVYNTDLQAYDYNIKIYYNPSTKRLIAENVSVGGGNVYISGALSSTGNGRIVAADGVADVTIDTTAVDRDLTVNSINNAVRNGYIKLTDTKQGEYGTIIEYKNGKYREYGRNEDPDKVNWNTNVPASYQPTEMAYRWTGGVSGSTEVVRMYYKKRFIAWGLISWTTTDDLVEKIAAEGGVPSVESSSVMGDGQTIATGITLDTADLSTYNTKFSVTGSSNQVGDTKRSETVVDKDYDGWYGKIVGTGTVKYSWTETKLENSQTVTTLKANSPISIGFIGQGTDNISIKGAQNVNLEGSISNVLDTGNVKLVAGATEAAQLGAVDGSNGNVNTNDLQVEAKSGITINATAKNTEAETMATTSAYLHSLNGDVTYNQKQGNVEFVAKDAANISNGSDNGNVVITAEGNITTAGDINSSATAYIKGNRIDLVSEKGAITASIQHADKPISSDTMSASINAKAVGNVTLVGRGEKTNMRIGHIESSEGDVNLTTTGSFEDAVGDNFLSDADKKLKHWSELGLVSELDKADERTNSAIAAKNARVSALEASGLAMEMNLHAQDRVIDAEGKERPLSDQEIKDRATAGLNALLAEAENLHNDDGYKAAKEQYIKEINASTTEAEKKAAEAKLKTQLKKYFAGSSYTKDEQDLIYHYEQANYSDNYGWSKTDLLYAISDSILNSEPGEIVTVDIPNIKAHSIVLNNAHGDGGVGVDAPPVAISYNDLTKEDNLKLLANAKGGDLTWDDANSQVIVRKENPLTVQIAHAEDLSEHGTITVNSKKNVYLAGVKDTVLEIHGSINTSGDVKLMSDRGVEVDGDAKADITAKNLTVYGGLESVGSLENPILTDISGVLDANAEDSVYLMQVSDKNLVIQNVAVNGNIDLSAVGNMEMSTEAGKTMGYLRGSNVKLTTEGGNIGTAANGMRIDNRAESIIATAIGANESYGNVYLQGVNEGATNIKLVVGSDVNIHSEAAVVEQKNGSVVADNLLVEAVEGISLISENNQLHNVALYNVGREGTTNYDVALVNGGSKDLIVNAIAQSQAEPQNYLVGNVTITNIDDDPNSTATDNKLIVDGDILATGNISLNDSEFGIHVNAQSTSDGTPITVLSKDGVIALNANNSGIVAEGKLKSINGSVVADAINGDIYLADAEAKEMAAAGTNNGDIVIGTISAGTVVLYNEDANSSVTADKVIVDKHLVVQSANPNIDTVEAGPGANHIMLDVTGTGGVVKPNGSINIGSLDEKVDYNIANLAVGTAKVYTAGSINIGNLYVNGLETSELIAKEGIAIDSLTAKNKLYAIGYGNDASVYGTKPTYDDSKAIYYDIGAGTSDSGAAKLDLHKLFFNDKNKKPDITEVIYMLDHLQVLGGEGSGTGMSLYIDDTHNQTSSGRLLHVDDYYYVHNQRYSAESLSRIIADYKADNTYMLQYGDNVGLFERYNLYELPNWNIVNGQLTNSFVNVVLENDKDEE